MQNNPLIKPIAGAHKITITNATNVTQTDTLATGTRFVTVWATVACYVAFGGAGITANNTPTRTNIPVPANTQLTFPCEGCTKLATYGDGSAGSLYVWDHLNIVP